MLLREIDAHGPRLAVGVLGAARAADPAGGAASCCWSARSATIAVRPADLLGAVPRRDPREHALRRRTGTWRASAVDYFAADDGPSPVQHFWSLSAEEQFYVVWPLLLLAAALASRGAPCGAASSLIGRAAPRRASPGRSTSPRPTRPPRTSSRRRAPGSSAPAACSRCARARAAGGRAPRSRGPASRRSASRRVALLAGDAVPGRRRAAAGARRARRDRAGAPAPARAPLALARRSQCARRRLLLGLPVALAAARPRAVRRSTASLTRRSRLVILVLTILLAAGSRRCLVEDPVRRGRSCARRRPAGRSRPPRPATARRARPSAAGATSHVRGEVAQAPSARRAQSSPRTPECFGAAARDPRHPCANPRAAAARSCRRRCRRATAATRRARCVERTRPAPRLRVRRAARRGAKATIALIGDSHASHWRAALDVRRRARSGWHGVSITHTGCPFSHAVKDLREPDRSELPALEPRGARVAARGTARSGTCSSSAISGSVVDPRAGASSTTTGSTATCGPGRRCRRRSSGSSCSATRRRRARDDGGAASSGRSSARRRAGPRVRAAARAARCVGDPAAAAARATGADRVAARRPHPLHLRRRRCFPVVGGALVYKDEHHMTTVFARTLWPYLARRVDRLVKGA